MGCCSEVSEDEKTTKELGCPRDCLNGCDQSVKLKNNRLIYLGEDISKQQSIQAATWLFTTDVSKICSETLGE